MTDHLLQEIEEELRRDRAKELWNKYGNYVLGAVTAVALVVFGTLGWIEYTKAQRIKNGELFVAALAKVEEEGEAAAADAMAGVARESSVGYATLARLREAAMRADSGDVSRALEIYGEMAESDEIAPEFRDLARLLSIMHRLDNGDPGTLTEELAPLTADDNPWRYSALELTALLAYRAGDKTRAVEHYTRLADDAAAPQGLRARAAEMLSYLGG